MRSRVLLVFGIVLALASAAAPRPAAARPAAILWQADVAAGVPERHASLVIERDAAGVRLLSGIVVEGAPKLKARGPDGRGLLFVVRDAGGRPLLLGETLDASFVVHGDEPDPATGTLRSLSTTVDRIAFPLRVPLLPGARGVEILERVTGHEDLTADELRAAVAAPDARLMSLGELALPAWEAR